MGLHVLEALSLLRVTGEVAPGPPHPATPDAAADMPPGAEPTAKATALSASGRALGSGGRGTRGSIQTTQGTPCSRPSALPITHEETEAQSLRHLPGVMCLMAKLSFEPRNLAPKSVHFPAM